MTRRFRLAISGSCAVLAMMLCALYGQHVQEEADRVRAEALERYGGEVVSLVVAPEGLEAGEVVDGRNVTERDWLADLAPEGAVVGLDEVMGAEVTIPAAAGAPLTDLNFRDDEDAIEVPSGRVALSLPVTESLGLPPSATEGTTLVAYRVSDTGVGLVSADLVVLRALGEQTGIGSQGSVTVAVTPEAVASVLSSSADGSLRLALPADDAEGLAEGSGIAPTSVMPEETTDEEGSS
ncbi:hypothetical protein NW198_03820 [Thermophilibacter sp. ET337]|uniref:SAF domain-containing protein n=1 Tax=Thermophilibacter sp. ET337 TaxID=2973084 RepID=UPI0021ACD4AC|nr:SAF domain-containing protein [Thermophilibacter sp. ET337]MCR8907742.1 hypothetical protein [Thermophilibacter sp. ET337]